jgi:hypothetical protein
MPQLTLRSGLTGMLIGGILSLTNLYMGAGTGKCTPPLPKTILTTDATSLAPVALTAKENRVE